MSSVSSTTFYFNCNRNDLDQEDYCNYIEDEDNIGYSIFDLEFAFDENKTISSKEEESSVWNKLKDFDSYEKYADNPKVNLKIKI